MFDGLRLSRWSSVHRATSGVQLVLLAIAAQTHSRLGWLVCIALLAAISLVAWASAYRRRRAITDTPTAKVATAAQGYAELTGTGRPLDGLPIVAPGRHVPCLWFRYLVEERNHKREWTEVQRSESEGSFILDDGTGQCLIDPAGAEIVTRHKETTVADDTRTTLWLLLNGDPLYAIGDFRTVTGLSGELDPNADVRDLLAEWKKDPAALARRFDLNGDGTIDEQEWLLARQAAKREVARNHDALRAAPDIHLLARPADGRLFLVSNLSEAKLARRYGLWCLFHLALFFAAVAGLPWLWAEGAPL
ncbi:hypothetical protein [Oryzomicrobium sp.]|uniref:hypothetical protein n=1 Tax=Oryzomicrobium sp. TaxID=1911578 RepID=UPI0025D7D4E2|nr:hypothetical protein [Oryzomicrobium sp.]MCE1241924.1 E3 ubiquitin ligase family protein [Oryzomicrobium sp.]